MDKKQFEKALVQLKAVSPEKKFKQTIDLIINFKGLDLKKPDNQLDFFVQLHYNRGKSVRICGFVGAEIADEAKKVLNGTVIVDDFDKYQQDKKLLKKLSKDYDLFIAQANIMAKVATVFGRVLGPKQKMPNPKAGCVIPPNAAVIKPTFDKLQKQVRVSVKTAPHFQCGVGTEDMKDEELLDNILSIYNNVVHHLPGENHNIKNVCLKKTMGPAIKVGEDHTTQEAPTKKSLLKKSVKKTEAAVEKETSPAEVSTKSVEKVTKPTEKKERSAPVEKKAKKQKSTDE